LTPDVAWVIICLIFLFKTERRQKMAQNEMLSQETFHGALPPLLRTHPLYIDLGISVEPVLEPEQALEKPLGSPNIRFERWNEKRRLVFDRILKSMSERDLPWKSEVEDYLRHQYRRNLQSGTFNHTNCVITKFLIFVHDRGLSQLKEIQREHIEAWIESEQDQSLHASTVNTRLKTVKAFLRYLMDRDILPYDLLGKRFFIKVPESLPRAMDPEDVRRLLSVVDHIRNRAIILVLLRTGMRVGELLNTLVEDVKLREQRIEIYEAPKTRVGRVVYLSDDAVDALGAWFAERDGQKQHLFHTSTRDTVTYSAMRAMFRNCLASAGLSHKGYGLHCLRHTCASELLNAGMRLECIQQLLGHSTIEMTRKYARLTDRTREEEYFRAMRIIERGEVHGHYQLDRELQTFLETQELLSTHHQELYEHSETVRPVVGGAG
jgi:integrase/recombinase XerD